ncbi:hypothetical protein P7C71_g217, partial [Lecanoromycetidae sp. Uapishka_2]
MTPLSILQPLSKKSKRDDRDSYERKVRQKSFEDSAPKADFGMAYRDASSTLGKTAPDMGSLVRNTKIPGLLESKPPETPIDPASTTAATKETTGFPPVNDIPSNHKATRASFADMEKVFKSRHLYSIPEIPNLAPLSKENIALLSIKHSDGFRLLESTHGHANDIEDEADDECTTECDDTETHVGDRDNDTLNPGEFHAYRMEDEELRAGIKNITINKRTCVDFEDAELKAEAEEKANPGLRSNEAAKSNHGTRDQPGFTVPLKNEESTQRSKKVKVASPVAENNAERKSVDWAQTGISNEASRVDVSGITEIDDAVRRERGYS